MVFELQAVSSDTGARAGLLSLPHGDLATPVFMPVGTRATVKGIRNDDLVDLASGIILSNAFHLYLRPGAELIERAGGIHRFMNWSGNVLTDSGGYQVFSLSALRRITEEGVRFQSPVDGSYHTFTPEGVMEIERRIGADIIMAFDECSPYPCDRDYARESLERTTRWAARCRQAFQDGAQTLFGIVQGSVYPDLRLESARRITDIGFAGYAVGGLSVGESKEEMLPALSAAASALPVDSPRYLMGVGLPEDIIDGVARGMDMFDCVLPTRMGRNGTVFTMQGRMNIRNAAYAEDYRPIEEGCPCPACKGYTRAYVRHLFKCGEMLAAILATTHNLAFYKRLMQGIRQAVLKDVFSAYSADFLASYRGNALEQRA
ncbi:MAG: tRNA guanosine(34) transglycosylase Tgt [bacterium]|nr:tRNA guanosine(34) transglycosylase Tgt [bacterium]